MFYHVRITQKSKRSSDEVKLDLSKEQLEERFINPYQEGSPIIINGKTVTPNDIDRIRISESAEPSSEIIKEIKNEDRLSNVVFIGGPSSEWRVADRAKDITDEIIKKPPGHKKGFPDTEIVKKTEMSSKRIFVVHGHDSELKNDIVSFIHEIGLEPIILHKQPDEGLTVIEKFEKHADVNFVIVLLTPDDVGCLEREFEEVAKNKKMELRARQNVIFEFGYFIGKLGRSKVCCVYKEGVKLPSDLSGLLYKEVKGSVEDIGYSLIKELQNAGLTPMLKK